MRPLHKHLVERVSAMIIHQLLMNVGNRANPGCIWNCRCIALPGDCMIFAQASSNHLELIVIAHMAVSVGRVLMR